MVGTSLVLGNGRDIVGSFLQGMRELGYVDGNNIDIVHRYSEGYQDRLPALAAELVPAAIAASRVSA
jgi:putative ABC transport system substrate-binding protein